MHPKTRRKFTVLENAGCSRSGGTAMAENGSRGSPGRRGLKDMKPLPRLQFGEGVGAGGIRQSMDSVRSVHESLPGSPSMLSMRGCMAVSVSGIAPACRRVYRSACLQQYGARTPLEGRFSPAFQPMFCPFPRQTFETGGCASCIKMSTAPFPGTWAVVVGGLDSHTHSLALPLAPPLLSPHLPRLADEVRMPFQGDSKDAGGKSAV